MISSVKRIWPRLKPNNLIQFLSSVTSGASKSLAENKDNKQTKEMEKKYSSSLACPQQQQYHSTPSRQYFLLNPLEESSDQYHYAELEHRKL